MTKLSAATACCLVVDDEPLVRRSVVRMLEPLGFRCIEAGSGRQGMSSTWRCRATSGSWRGR